MNEPQTETPKVQSETSKHRHFCEPYCKGNGVDLGSGGDPVVPHAIQFDLPPESSYGIPGHTDPNIHWRSDASKELPFKDETLDFLHSSHLLEDFADWTPVLQEWDRVLKRGGYMMISVPDHARFRAAVAGGQGDNLAHKHESREGELTEHFGDNYEPIRDAFVTTKPTEYSILFIARKK